MTLQRRTPLRRDTPKARAFAAKRGTLARKPLDRGRKPLPARSAKAKASDPELEAARRVVRARSDGACEIADPVACGTGERHDGHHAHHVLRRPHTGGVHDPARMLWVCWTGHRWAHDHPAVSNVRGWIVRSS